MARTDVYLFYPVVNCTRSVFGRVIRGGPNARHIRAVGHSRNDQTDAVRVCRPRLLFLANYSGLSRINWPGPTPTATIIVCVRDCVINLTNLLSSPPLRSVLSTRSVIIPTNNNKFVADRECGIFVSVVSSFDEASKLELCIFRYNQERETFS